MKTDDLKLSKRGSTDGLSQLIRKIRGKITGLFEPEEVEVTFKNEGKTMSYTYTKVPHKQVA